MNSKYRIMMQTLIILVLLVAGALLMTNWQVVWGNAQPQSLPGANPDQVIIQGLQEALNNPNLDADSRVTLQNKLEMMQNLEAQRHPANAGKGSKPSAPPAPPAAVQLNSTAPQPEEGIIEGSEGLVHPWQYSIRNLWQKKTGADFYQVLAGASAEDPKQGVLIVIRSRGDTLQREQQVYPAPVKNGELRITGAQGMTLILTDQAGKQFTFDLQTDSYTLP